MNLEIRNERRNNTIYTDDNTMYKIFKKGYSKNDVFMESFITTYVESLGIKVVSIEEVTQIDGQWAFKSNRHPGKTLFELINENPEKTDEYLNQLVEIQTSIHKYKCPELPIQRQKFTDYINISNLDSSLKIDLQEMLNSSPKHKKVCHGNFTPHHVLISDGEVYILDWNHATQGNASADVARTYLWMKLYMPNFADSYLEKFCEKTNTSSRYVKNWIPIVAASRIHKNNPEEIRLLRDEISVVEY